MNHFNCVSCHSLPTGAGANRIATLSGAFPSIAVTFTPIDPNPDGNLHATVVSLDGSAQHAFKVPQLRNLYEKIGANMRPHTTALAGFGFFHDGSVDTLSRFVDQPTFTTATDQDVADLVAFLMSFAGGDFPLGSETGSFEFADTLPVLEILSINIEQVGEPSRDTHAGVGKQAVITSAAPVPPEVTLMLSEARETGMESPIPLRGVDLIVKGRKDSGGGNFVERGWVYDPVADNFKEDKNGDTISIVDLATIASASNPLTYMMVPRGSGTRLGVDQDEDGYYDRSEIEACTDPANPLSHPGLGAPDIDIASGLLNFGSRDVNAGPSGSQSVTISNTGTGALFFKGAKVAVIGADADQFAISNNPSLNPINPGSNQLLDIIFDPSSGGVKAASLLIVSDDCDSPTKTVSLTGIGTVSTTTPTPTASATPLNAVKDWATYQ